MVVSGVVSIAVVLAWMPILPIDNNSITVSTPSAAPSPIVDAKMHATTLVPPISYPLGENREMMALLDLHRQTRHRILTQDYKITVRLEDDGSRRVSQKTVWNLSD
jgi:hypothetical protein